MQRVVEPAACRDAIGSMLEEVDRLTRLVDSLLVLTRADSGALKAARETVDVAALAAGVVEQLRVLAEEKQQSLALDAPAPVGVRCDATLVRQALTNLVHNAIKYTPARGSIRVAVSPTSAGGAALEVRDDGPGIAARHRERIFERFYRVDAGRSRDEGGVGLGLAIARRAVEANGGRIELESEEGKGSIFKIVLQD